MQCCCWQLSHILICNNRSRGRAASSVSACALTRPVLLLPVILLLLQGTAAMASLGAASWQLQLEQAAAAAAVAPVAASATNQLMPVAMHDMMLQPSCFTSAAAAVVQWPLLAGVQVEGAACVAIRGVGS
jgi:hypothetical protein